VTTPRSTILVVDDDKAFREFVTGLLEAAGYATAEAGTGEEAIDVAQKERPALVLLDVVLPGVSGFEICRQLKEQVGPDLPVFLISGVRAEAFDRAAGLLIGRYATPDELVAGRTVAASVLTKREEEVLRLLAQGLDQSEIALQFVISEKTVATHIQHILEKLGVHSRAQAVALAHRSGLVEPTD
jgi:DNA-binding NarL/FixJ family response regulator